MKPISAVSLAALALAATVLLTPGWTAAAEQVNASADKSAPAQEPAEPEKQEEGIDGWEKVHLDHNAPPEPFDAFAAIRLAQKNGCFRCHHVEKTKTGPAFNAVGDAYKDDYKGGLERELSHLTAGDILVLNGNVEHHRVLRTDPPNDPRQLKNLVDWILSHRPPPQAQPQPQSQPENQKTSPQ